MESDSGFRTDLESALAKLAPYKISKRTGRLQEWIEDYEERKPGHRHMSHFYAFHPGDMISARTHPELTAAIRRSLEQRMAHGGGHTGWSRAYMVNLWARLGEGERAAADLGQLLARFTFPNLFGNRSVPWQIGAGGGMVAGWY